VEQTVKALADLRAHWESEGTPSTAKIAKAANVSSATAHRYLTGATKGGFPETIRALAIAMGRPDIAESLPYTSLNRMGDVAIELNQQFNEKITELEARHKQEIDALLRDHRIEREEWHVQRKVLHEENVSLRSSFDRAVAFRDAQLRKQYIEKTILFALFIASVVVLILK
jgi:transcriptional regulator with XRE-family HTH domain